MRSKITLPGNWAKHAGQEIIARAEAAGVSSAEAYELINTGVGLEGEYIDARERGESHASAYEKKRAANIADSFNRPSQWHGKSAAEQADIDKGLT